MHWCVWVCCQRSRPAPVGDAFCILFCIGHVDRYRIVAHALKFARVFILSRSAAVCGRWWYNNARDMAERKAENQCNFWNLFLNGFIFSLYFIDF
jgi:hypothetical protein